MKTKQLEYLSQDDLSAIDVIIRDAERKIAAISGVPVGLIIQAQEKTDKLPRITVISIIYQAIERHLDISPNKLRSKTRIKQIANARKVFCKLVKEFEPEITLKEIGTELHGRDHSTIIHNIDAFDDHYANEKAWRDMYHAIRNRIDFKINSMLK